MFLLVQLLRPPQIMTRLTGFSLTIGYKVKMAYVLMIQATIIAKIVYYLGRAYIGQAINRETLDTFLIPTSYRLYLPFYR